uniref:Uncharacterized protein n=1 Tax=Aegilops tauschii subsp. strangulata TaxID=200361 RepID=A0A453MXB5_AEGTS
SKINIWEDCLIPNSSSRKIITVRGNRVLTRVEELIDPITGAWDEDLIRDNLWHIDAERILQIPIHHQQTEDYIAWHLTKSGIFSVRSAYYRQWKDSYLTRTPSDGLSGSSSHPIWKKIWNLLLPA